MATRIGILETGLCQDAFEKAVKNAEKMYGEEWLKKEARPDENLRGIICKAFLWNDTPEGHDYWHEIVKNSRQ